MPSIDGQVDVFQYEQTHNVIQVWMGKLSELQLPAQKPSLRRLLHKYAIQG